MSDDAPLTPRSRASFKEVRNTPPASAPPAVAAAPAKEVELVDVKKSNDTSAAPAVDGASAGADAAPAPEKQVEYFALFRYATNDDWALLVVGGLLAAANGVFEK